MRRLANINLERDPFSAITVNRLIACNALPTSALSASASTIGNQSWVETGYAISPVISPWIARTSVRLGPRRCIFLAIFSADRKSEMSVFTEIAVVFRRNNAVIISKKYIEIRC